MLYKQKIKTKLICFYKGKQKEKKKKKQKNKRNRSPKIQVRKLMNFVTQIKLKIKISNCNF